MLNNQELYQQVQYLSARLNSLKKRAILRATYWDPEEDMNSSQESEDNIAKIFYLAKDRKVHEKDDSKGCCGWEVKTLRKINGKNVIVALGYRHNEMYDVEFFDKGNETLYVHCTNVHRRGGRDMDSLIVEKHSAATPQELIDWLDEFFSI